MTFEPELRPGPPWVMEEMIWAQLDLPEQIARGADADRLASHVRTAVDAGEPVLFTGCGTSEHAARAAQAIVGDALPDATLASRDAFETRLAPPTGGLVVAISHEAGTPATLDAARGASDAGAQVVLITAQPERAPAGVEPIRTPLHDRSWCHTVAYLSPLLLHAAFAGLGPQRAHDLSATRTPTTSPPAGASWWSAPASMRSRPPNWPSSSKKPSTFPPPRSAWRKSFTVTFPPPIATPDSCCCVSIPTTAGSATVVAPTSRPPPASWTCRRSRLALRTRSRAPKPSWPAPSRCKCSRSSFASRSAPTPTSSAVSSRSTARSPKPPAPADPHGPLHISTLPAKRAVSARPGGSLT